MKEALIGTNEFSAAEALATGLKQGRNVCSHAHPHSARARHGPAIGLWIPGLLVWAIETIPPQPGRVCCVSKTSV